MGIKNQDSVSGGKKDRSMAQKTGMWTAILMLVILGSAIAANGQEHLNSRMVMDQASRQVVIPGVVNKIVTTFKPATLCVLSLGLAPKLIGVDTSSKRDRLSKAVFPKINQIGRASCRERVFVCV